MASKRTEPVRLGSRYLLHDVIGRGGMGAVYLATDRLTDSTVALKHVTTAPADLMFASRGDDSSDLHLALAQEFKTLASLRHPNIVSVLDYGFDDQRQPFFTMEYVPDARTIVEVAEGKSTVERIDLMAQVLQALVYLHRRNILHRDLKPGNVLVTTEGKVKVLDFGLSLVSRHTVLDLTQTTPGTPAYLAPELLQGRRAHRGSDLYAAGVIAYEMFAGRFPYDDSNLGTLAVEILSKVVDLACLEASLRPVMERLLAKDPEERYRQAREVLDDLYRQCGAASPLPHMETTELRESFLQAASFVGRDAELALLSEALESAMRGQGSVWLIGGESGVGKTRLCEELRARALVEGALVLRGQAIREGGAPYIAWRDALRHLSLQTTLSDLEASVFKSLVPDIGPLIGREVADAPEVDPASSQRRFLSTVQEVFGRQTQPVTVIVEDLHWAGESLAVLTRLGQSVGRHPLLMIGTYRLEEAPDLPARSGLNLNAPEVHLLTLERLDEKAIADLSASVLGEEAGRQEGIVQLLQRETEGNVFFVIEVLRALAEEAGELDQIATMPLPPSVRAEGTETVARRRLRQVPEAARPLLRLAAVAGRELDLAVLQAALRSGPTPAEAAGLEAWLAACAEALVLEVGERGAQGDRWHFAHDRLREALLADIPPGEARALHRQVAEAMEQVHAEDPAQAALLAHHWREAGDLPRETHYTAQAGLYALESGVYKEALPLLERALAQAERAGLSPLRQAELESGLGEALQGLGQPHASIAHCERALVTLGWRVPATAPGLLLGIVWETGRQVGHRLLMDLFHQRLKATIAPAVMGIAGKSAYPLCAQNYIFLKAIPTYYHILQYTNQAERGGEMALPEQAIGYGMTMLLMGTATLHSVAEHYRRKANAALRQCQDPRAGAIVAATSSMYGLCRAQWEWTDNQPAADRARRFGNLSMYTHLRAVAGHALHFRAQWDEQWNVMSELLEFCRRQNDHHFSNVCLWHLAESALRRGRHDEAQALLDECQPDLEAVEDVPHLIGAYGMRAEIDLARGEMELAEQQVAKALNLMFLPLGSWALNGYSAVAEVALTQLEQEPSLRHRWQVVRAMRHMRLFALLQPVGKPRLAVFACWRAGLRGDHRRAARIAQRGIRLSQQLQTSYDEGLLHYHTGRFLPESDAARREHLGQALAIFERLGAAHDAECTRKLL
jgi:tetratricopeptide (TPR) repeat protein